MDGRRDTVSGGPSPRWRAATAAVLSSRIAYGMALAAAPGRLATPWLGPDTATGPGQVALRGLGVREAALHAGILVALGRRRPIRGWLVVSLAGDLADVAATVAQRRQLPRWAAPKTVAAGGGSAALTAALLASDR